MPRSKVRGAPLMITRVCVLCKKTYYFAYMTEYQWLPPRHHHLLLLSFQLIIIRKKACVPDKNLFWLEKVLASIKSQLEMIGFDNVNYLVIFPLAVVVVALRYYASSSIYAFFFQLRLFTHVRYVRDGGGGSTHEKTGIGMWNDNKWQKWKRNDLPRKAAQVLGRFCFALDLVEHTTRDRTHTDCDWVYLKILQNFVLPGSVV